MPSSFSCLEQLDRFVHSFEDDWICGRAPDIRQAVETAGIEDEQSRLKLTIELAIIDLSKGWAISAPVGHRTRVSSETNFRRKVEDYFDLFPDLKNQPTERWWPIVLEEYRMRRLAGDHFQRAEYRERFSGITADQETDFDAIDHDLAIRSPTTIDEIDFGDRAEVQPWINSDYEVLEKIASGGMGVVYRARQLSLNRIVALKTIRQSETASEEAIVRFHMEAKAVANLTHQNIVPIYEVKQLNGLHFFSMGYVDGQSLAQYLETNGPINPKIAAKLCRDVALAMHYSHRQGIIHRDLKPSNILLDDAGKPHITDFGLAKEMWDDGHLTTTGQILGTPSFMPPEQADSAGKASELSDVYSMGAVLYSMLTGHPPFQGNTPIETLRKVIETEVISPKKLNPGLPSDLETICLRCLQKEPDRRYASALNLAEDLDRFLLRIPIMARPVGRWERVVRWCLRNPAVALSLASIILILSISFAGVFWYSFRLSNLAQDEQAAKLQVMQEQSRSLAASGVLRLQNGDTGGIHDLLDSIDLVADDNEKRLSRIRLANAWIDEVPAEIEHVFGHHNSLIDATYVGNGQQLITATPTGQIKVWNAEDGSLLIENLQHEKGSVLKRIVTVGNDDLFLSIDQTSHVNLWSIKKGHRIGRKTGLNIAATNGGQWIACSSLKDKTKVEICRADDLTLVRTISVESDSQSLVFSVDQSLLAVASEGMPIQVFQVHDGSQLWKINSRNKQIVEMRFSPTNERLAVVYSDDLVEVWQMGLEKPVLRKHHEEDVHALDFSPDGNLLAAGGQDSKIRIWKIVTGESHCMPLVHNGPVRSLEFSKDGRQLVSGGLGTYVRVWDTASGRPLNQLMQHQGAISETHFHPTDTERFISASRDGTARQWRLDRRNGRIETLVHQDRVWSIDFSQNGEKLVAACENGDVQIWQTTHLRKHLKLSHPMTLIEARFHPGSRDLLTANNSASIRLWSQRSDYSRWIEPELKQNYRCVEFSPDGLRVAAGTDGPNAFLFDFGKSPVESTQMPHPAAVRTIAFHSKMEIVATGCDDGRIRIWKSKTGEFLKTPISLDGPIECICFSPNGQLIAAVTEHDRNVRFFDCKKWENYGYALLPKAAAQDIAFSPDSRLLATACTNGEVQLWDVESGLPCGLPIRHKMMATCIRFSPDGRWMASGSFDKTVHLWKLPEWFGDVDSATTKVKAWKAIGIRRDESGIERALNWKKWRQLHQIH